MYFYFIYNSILSNLCDYNVLLFINFAFIIFIFIIFMFIIICIICNV